MAAKIMKALRFAEFGPPSVLRIQEVGIPEPGEGEALVQVKAAAINPSDSGNVAGRFKTTTLPRTPGRDLPARLLLETVTGVKRCGAAARSSVSCVMDLTQNMSLFPRRCCHVSRSR